MAGFTAKFVIIDSPTQTFMYPSSIPNQAHVLQHLLGTPRKLLSENAYVCGESGRPLFDLCNGSGCFRLF